MTPELIKSNLILILFFLPLAGAFFIAFSKDEMAKPLARIFSVLLVLCSVWMLSMFDPSQNFQFEHVWRWVSMRGITHLAPVMFFWDITRAVAKRAAINYISPIAVPLLR